MVACMHRLLLINCRITVQCPFLVSDGSRWTCPYHTAFTPVALGLLAAAKIHIATMGTFAVCHGYSRTRMHAGCFNCSTYTRSGTTSAIANTRSRRVDWVPFDIWEYREPGAPVFGAAAGFGTGSSHAIEVTRSAMRNQGARAACVGGTCTALAGAAAGFREERASGMRTTGAGAGAG